VISLSRQISASAAVAPIPADDRQPYLLFLTVPADYHRRVATVPLANPFGDRMVSDMECDRVYFRAGTGLCVGSEGTVAYRYNAVTFDAQLHVNGNVEIRGLPSRARISPDGRLGSMTVFVAGDGYGGPFSTRTLLANLSPASPLANLEDFAVTKDGQPFQAPDFNFWGVTFIDDSRHFYATLGTGGRTYLVRGDVGTKTMTTLMENVECPSLSPDGKHIVYKHAIAQGGVWRLYVLDLATMQTSPLAAETRNVDDQVEWLDNSHILYEFASPRPDYNSVDVWEASIDSGESSHVFVKDAASPVVVRPG
jgi:hypothetical protein